MLNEFFNGGSGVAGYEIERSLRFNSADSAYLNRTPSSAGNRRTFTFSFWVKRGKLPDADQLRIFNCGPYTAGTGYRSFNISFNGKSLWVWDYLNTYNVTLESLSFYRDPSAWYHIAVIVDTTQATSTDRVKIYVNGEAVTGFVANTYPSQNYDMAVGVAEEMRIGTRESKTTHFFDGYLADFRYLDGVAASIGDLGEFDDNGVWQPIKYTGTYGTNGYHLDFSDNSSSAALGTDTSGNSNDWTVNNISVTAGAGNDSLFDSPTNGTQTDTGAGGEVSGNYATYNPLYNNAVGGGNGAILSDGNLKTTFTTSGSTGTVPATIFVSSGKWYCEFTAENISGGAEPQVGIIRPDDAIDGYIGKTGTNGVGYEPYQDRRYNAGTPTSSMFGQTTTSGTHIYGLALDLDVGTLDVYEDGTLLGELVSGLSGTWAFAVADIGEADVPTIIANFGQRPFAYAAPSGFKALCTTNLDDPTIADGSTAMDVVIYDGTQVTRSITGLEFGPDLVWTKSRSNTTSNELYDSVRGAQELLYSDLTNGETTVTNGISSFNSDGWTMGNRSALNYLGRTYVAWTWDAGTSTVSNTDGTITSSVRANPSAGFSIVSYTGNGTAGATVGHGLNAEPSMVITKTRETAAANNWTIYHKSVGNTKAAYFDTNSFYPDAGYWNNTSPTSSVVTLGNYAVVNASSKALIMYAFAPVEGYSAFGSYEANADANGPFIYTGFRVAWLMIKATTSGNSNTSWYIFDTTREPINPNKKYLLANTNNTEGNFHDVDLLSNGFKIRANYDGTNNTSRDPYIYAAFAEHPFKTARAR